MPLGEMRHRRRTSAVLPRGTATGVAHVAVRTVSLKRLAAAALMPRTETIVSSSRLTNREVWSLSRRRRLTFDSWKLSPNQRTVNGPLIRGRLVLLVVVFRLRRYWFFVTLDGLRLHGFLNGFFEQLFVLVNRPADLFRVVLVVDYSLRRGGGDGRQNGWRLGFLPLTGHASMLVFVVRVTRRTSCLLDVVTDHRDDDVIRQPSLARTVVIENVTRTKLALLHQELPRILAGGERKCERCANLSRAGFRVAIGPSPASARHPSVPR
jgi:hypothetical protein